MTMENYLTTLMTEKLEEDLNGVVESIEVEEWVVGYPGTKVDFTGVLNLSALIESQTEEFQSWGYNRQTLEKFKELSFVIEEHFSETITVGAYTYYGTQTYIDYKLSPSDYEDLIESDYPKELVDDYLVFIKRLKKKVLQELEWAKIEAETLLEKQFAE